MKRQYLSPSLKVINVTTEKFSPHQLILERTIKFQDNRNFPTEVHTIKALGQKTNN